MGEIKTSTESSLVNLQQVVSHSSREDKKKYVKVLMTRFRAVFGADGKCLRPDVVKLVIELRRCTRRMEHP